jgi:hypothetical protein
MASAFALIDVESSPSNSATYPVPVPPRKAFPKDYHSIPLPRSQDDLELENIQWRASSASHKNPVNAPTSGTQTPGAVNDLEMSRPTSPILNELDGVDAMQSFSNPPANRFRMLAVCLMIFANGLSDSAPGALIPYIERYVAEIIVYLVYSPVSDIIVLAMLWSL